MASKDYEVGYGKPPKHTQFQKNQSGNPHGRPPRPKSSSALITAAMSQKITISEGGEPRKLTKAEVIVRQLTNKAAAGDPRLMKLSLELLQQAEAQEALRAEGSRSAAEMKVQDAALLSKLFGAMGMEEADDGDA